MNIVRSCMVFCIFVLSDILTQMFCGYKLIRVRRLQNFKSYICNPVMSPCVPLPKKSIKFNRHAAWRAPGMPDMDVVTS